MNNETKLQLTKLASEILLTQAQTASVINAESLNLPGFKELCTATNKIVIHVMNEISENNGDGVKESHRIFLEELEQWKQCTPDYTPIVPFYPIYPIRYFDPMYAVTCDV